MQITTNHYTNIKMTHTKLLHMQLNKYFPAMHINMKIQSAYESIWLNESQSVRQPFCVVHLSIPP